MLKELVVKNLVIVEYQSISFERGLNVLTGETGTGKSLVVDALVLLSGVRVREDLVKIGASCALVEALFEVQNNPEVQELLKEEGLLYGDEVVLSREISSRGKSKCRVNGRSVPLAFLKKLSSRLFDVYGQGEQINFFEPGNRLCIVDALLDQEALSCKKEYRRVFREWKETCDRLAALGKDVDSRLSELREIVEELDSLGLSDEEIFQVESDFNRMANAQLFLEVLGRALREIEGDELEEGILSRLSRIEEELRSLPRENEKLQELELAIQNLSGLCVDLQEVSYVLGKFRESFSFSEEEIRELEEKIELLERLKRKYRCLTTGSFVKFQRESKEKLAELENTRLLIERLQERRYLLENELNELAAKLSLARKKAAQSFSELVERELAQLGLEKARFKVDFYKERVFTEEGTDMIEFLISVNPGQKMGKVLEVASGGEISRIVLAIKSLISGLESLPVLVFDEIDQGVGGRTAFWLGERLKKLAENHQVICVTHLPQIACFADHHLRVRKHFVGEKVEVEVRSLFNREERVEELARMLGAGEGDRSGVEYARTLLERVGGAGN